MGTKYFILEDSLESFTSIIREIRLNAMHNSCHILNIRTNKDFDRDQRFLQFQTRLGKSLGSKYFNSVFLNVEDLVKKMIDAGRDLRQPTSEANIVRGIVKSLVPINDIVKNHSTSYYRGLFNADDNIFYPDVPLRTIELAEELGLPSSLIMYYRSVMVENLAKVGLNPHDFNKAIALKAAFSGADYSDLGTPQADSVMVALHDIENALKCLGSNPYPFKHHFNEELEK